MPVHEFGSVGVIVNVDYYLLPFLEAQQGTRELAIVERRGDDVVRREFDQTRRDPQGVISLRLRGFIPCQPNTRDEPRERKQSAISKQKTAVDWHGTFLELAALAAACQSRIERPSAAAFDQQIE